MRRVVPALVLALLLVGCTDPGDEQPAELGTDLVGTWQLRSQLPRGIDPDAHERITLTVTRDADGLVLGGTAVCTTYAGRATIGAEVDSVGRRPLRLVHLSTDEGGCSADELAARASYLAGLGVVDAFLASGPVLVLEGTAIEGRPFGTGFTFDRVQDG